MSLETELAPAKETTPNIEDLAIGKFLTTAQIKLINIHRGNYGEDLQKEASKLIAKSNNDETPKLFERLINLRERR